MLDMLGDDEMRARFDEIDRDSSGAIDALELKTVLKEEFEVNLSLDDVAGMVARVDLDGCVHDKP